MKLFLIILAVLVVIFTLIMAMACCYVAKQADEADEKLLREYLLQKNAQKPPVT